MTSRIATTVLDSVEDWAGHTYWLLRETGCFVKGRIDGLLVPIALDAHSVKKIPGHYSEGVRVTGIEVKTTRADFLAGLKKGQFERYDETLSGLYIATPREVCKTSEIPDGIGHLSIRRQNMQWVCTCRRHPKYKDTEPPVEWVWELFFRYTLEMREREHRERCQYDDALHRIGAEAAGHLFGAVREIERQCGLNGSHE